MRCTATFGTAVGVPPIIDPITPPIDPPGTPPGTPPTTPMDGGGASSSLIISTFLGILVGVRRLLLVRSLCPFFTPFTGTGGGGGGGGGGGATKAIMSCAFGN